MTMREWIEQFWGEEHNSRGHSKFEGPEVETYLKYSRCSEKPSAAGAEREEEEGRGS